MQYIPDRWVVVKINNGGETFFKVLAGWSGSYLYGSSWRLNSGIIKVEEEEDSYHFNGHSKSSYLCHKDAYGITGDMAQILGQLEDKFGDRVSLMPRDTDWKKVIYEESTI